MSEFKPGDRVRIRAGTRCGLRGTVRSVENKCVVIDLDNGATYRTPSGNAEKLEAHAK